MLLSPVWTVLWPQPGDVGAGPCRCELKRGLGSLEVKGCSPLPVWQCDLSCRCCLPEGDLAACCNSLFPSAGVAPWVPSQRREADMARTVISESHSLCVTAWHSAFLPHTSLSCRKRSQAEPSLCAHLGSPARAESRAAGSQGPRTLPDCIICWSL